MHVSRAEERSSGGEGEDVYVRGRRGRRNKVRGTSLSSMARIGMRISCRGFFFFFFQAEDGIRDLTVTGVQTCALPIFESGDAIVETKVTDAREHVRRFTFNDRGSVLTDTKAFGTPLAAQTTNEYEADGVRLKSSVDPLQRKTSYVYDTNGQVKEKTVLAGTAEARTEKWERNGPHAELTKYTDTYNKDTIYELDPRGAVKSVTDPVNRKKIYETNALGLVTKVTDPNNKFTIVD